MFLLGSVTGTKSLAQKAAFESEVDSIVGIGLEGAGNERASMASAKLIAAGPAALLPVVRAAGKGNTVADNWLRVVGNTIVDRAVRARSSVPYAELREFVLQTAKPEPARVLAFDLLMQGDPEMAHGMEDALVNDPIQSLRRGAVSKRIAAAESAPESESKKLWMRALAVVRDEDQTKIVVDALKKRGETVDLPKHFGFLTRWHVIGPFENAERKGFEAVFAPEREIDLGKSYDGKGGRIGWQKIESKDEYGKVDFNKPLTALKEATAYACTTLEAAEETDVELRLGCKNAWKVWLNGQLLFGRDEYHRGQKMDQYKLKCRLKKGVNALLIKCCQNEQTESWTVEWEFQMRVCDSAGTGLQFSKANP